MKAYDNFEEINPDVIVVNAQDYPRHWKIIASAANFRLSKHAKMILLVNEDFSEKEEADALSVCMFSYSSEDTFNKPLFIEALNAPTEEHVASAKINYDEYFDEEDFPAPTVEEILAKSGDEYISTFGEFRLEYQFRP